MHSTSVDNGQRKDSLVTLPAELLPAASGRTSGTTASGLLIGVDGGATKTIAAVFDLDAGTVTAAETGPSNPEAVGYEGASASINEAISEAFGQAKPVAAAVLGVAGIDTESERKRLLSGVTALSAPLVLAVNDVVAANEKMAEQLDRDLRIAVDRRPAILPAELDEAVVLLEL